MQKINASKIHFDTLQDAIEYAKQNGGWIAQTFDEAGAVWYSSMKYTMTTIFQIHPGPCQVGMWSFFMDEPGYAVLNEMTRIANENRLQGRF